jgi:hypothetical protein
VPIAARKPSAVSDTSIKISLSLSREPVACQRTLRNYNTGICAFLTPDTPRFCCMADRGDSFIHLGGGKNVAFGSDSKKHGHVPRITRGSFHRSSEDQGSAGAPNCGLQRPTWFLRCGRQASKSTPAIVPTVKSFSFLGAWTRGSSAELLFVLPSFTSCEAPFFVESGAEESTPAFPPLTGRPATTPQIRANLSVAELPAARRGLFDRGDEFGQRGMGVVSFCLCRQRRGPPSGQWPGRSTPGDKLSLPSRQVLVVGSALPCGGSGDLARHSSLLPRASSLGVHWTGLWLVGPTL